MAFFTAPTKTQFALGQVPKILITVLAVFCLGLSGCPDKPNTPPVRETRISILQINLRPGIAALDRPNHRGRLQ